MANGNLSNQSTEKALTVLEYLVAQREPVKLQDLAQDLGMNVSTASRFLSALQHRGYADQDPQNAKYFATMKICGLANQMISHFSLASVAHPYVQQASEYFQETACFSIEKNNAVLYIDIVVGSSKTLMNIQQIGNSAPLHCTSAGKLFLSQYTEEELDHYIERTGLPRFTANTITTRTRLFRELQKIRIQGFSIDDNENEEGIRCLSYPVYDYTQQLVACLSITGPSIRLSPSVLESKHHYLEETANELSRRLGKIF